MSGGRVALWGRVRRSTNARGLIMLAMLEMHWSHFLECIVGNCCPCALICKQWVVSFFASVVIPFGWVLDPFCSCRPPGMPTRHPVGTTGHSPGGWVSARVRYCPFRAINGLGLRIVLDLGDCCGGVGSRCCGVMGWLGGRGRGRTFRSGPHD